MSTSENYVGGSTGLVIGILIGVFIGVFISEPSDELQKDFEMAQAEVEAVRAEYEGQCEVVREDYQAALRKARTSIEEANSQIADAQSYAGASYKEMSVALQDLYEVDEADDPRTECFP